MATLLERLRARSWFPPLARLPMLSFRLGLGGLVGRYFMVLTTRGHKSGRPRHTMLAYASLADRRYVMAAYGAGSHWLRNIEADPRVTVQTAKGAEPSLARPLREREELERVFDLMQRRDPVSLRLYLAARGLPFERSALVSDEAAVITFEPTTGSTPPALEADLRWIWRLAPLLVALGAAARRRLR